ncbi:Uncharacterized protein TCM_024935 [Theobroma cacao]|uniref:Uncharacterized protein n=1 Tax=Theobroma cacao TaxID=3641 RepID=A0A061EXW7_THECC|nr:Uncharacterized protein TCM_024935 [Theobroma cacao]
MLTLDKMKGIEIRRHTMEWNPSLARKGARLSNKWIKSLPQYSWLAGYKSETVTLFVNQDSVLKPDHLSYFILALPAMRFI